MFLAAEDPGSDPGLFQATRHFAADHRHRSALVAAQGLQAADNGGAGDGVEVLEGQFLQFGADALTADRAGERRVDIAGFPGDTLALVLALDVVERAHVVQPVRQLDHQDAHVLGDGQDEFAQVLRLAQVLGIQLQPGELGHPLHQFADLGSEQFVDIGAGDRGVLDHVVQQGGDDGGGVQPIFGQNPGDLDGMGEIGIARGPHLRAVHAHAVDIGAVEQGFVGGWVIALDPLDQLILAQDLGPRLGLGRDFGLRRGEVRGRFNDRRVRSRV